MNRKLIVFAVVVFLLICAAESLYKTWEAEKKRREALMKQEESPEESPEDQEEETDGDS